MNLQPRGHVRVVSAVLRPTSVRPHMFSFFTEDGKDYQLYVENAEELHMWMNALPIYSGQVSLKQSCQASSTQPPPPTPTPTTTPSCIRSLLTLRAVRRQHRQDHDCVA